jgi:hypothetical protein
VTAPGQYRESFPTALPGGKGRPVQEPSGAALPGFAKAKKKQLARRKKATGYAYAPVGKPLPARKEKKARSQFADVRGGKSTTATKAAYRKAIAAEKKAQKEAAKVLAVASKPSKLGNLARRAGSSAAKVTAGVIARQLFPGGRSGAKRRVEVAKKAVELGKKVIGTRAGQIGAIIGAGVGAYAITRKSKLGGKGGDAVVAAYFRSKDRSADARLRQFRQAVAAERAQGKVSSARIRELAHIFGFTG